jgi:hypothetical protein
MISGKTRTFIIQIRMVTIMGGASGRADGQATGRAIDSAAWDRL